MRSLKGKTLFITGASRGIGRAIALRAAADGANIAIASKTDEPNPKLPGTSHTVADEIVAAGGRALPIAMDVRREEEIEAAVAKTANTFGGIDILVNNASALFLAKTPETPMKRFDLMFSVNVRGTFATDLGGPSLSCESRESACPRPVAAPEIMADAADAILTRDSAACTGNFFIDDAVLAAEGVNDLETYIAVPGSTLVKDLFVA